jgi:hypothetical protein
MAGYIGNQAQIRSGLSATIDELNIIDGVTATTAELNYNDTGAAVGTVVASKTVTADANKDVASLRNVTATGVATVGSVVVADGGNIGAASDTDSLAIASNGVVTFSQAPVFPDGSLNLADLDIDGGTDINAALVDADLMIVDDGAGGTNRKATMTRLATYVGTKITGGAMVFIASSGALSDAASVQFRAQDGHFDETKYDHYIFKFMYLIPATDGVYPIAQVSTNDGDAYDTTDGNYHFGENQNSPGYYLSPVYNMGSDANEYGMCGEMELFGPHLTNYTFADIRTQMISTGGVLVDASAKKNQVHLVEADVDAIKFSFNSGNIESGEIVMYGIANGT